MGPDTTLLPNQFTVNPFSATQTLEDMAVGDGKYQLGRHTKILILF